MSASFYLFDVDHGQCAAVKLPNGRWCVFDAGASALFSPIDWIRERMDEERRAAALLSSALVGRSINLPQPRILKATISHLHGDHLTDWRSLVQANPEYLLTVNYDQDYLADMANSSTPASAREISAFRKQYLQALGPAWSWPDYGGATIEELSLSVTAARLVPGDVNARVNNASVATRLACHGTSILLCGDVHAEAWSFALLGSAWQDLARDVDVLVAPHHGHSSGFSTDLLRIARPRVVLASIVSKDPHIDGRYSSSEFVRGARIGNGEYRCMTTRRKGHILIDLDDAGARTWSFGNAALNSTRKTLV